MLLVPVSLVHGKSEGSYGSIETARLYALLSSLPLLVRISRPNCVG